MKKTIFLILTVLIFCVSCGNRNDYAPKPTTYLRIELPAHAYHCYDTVALPFRFECANCAEVCMKKDKPSDKWVDVRYPDYKGIVYLSYRKIHGTKDLYAQIDTSYLFLKQHYDYAGGVDEKVYENPQRRVYATTFQLKGDHVASTYQFWVTDSNEHFLRGSLFLDCTPSNDSLAPVINYLQEDLRHLLETLEWK